MANTYPTTQFPLGSTEVKVLFNNASNFDEAMNSELPSFYDRFNKRRETWAGMQKMVADFLEAMGFEATHLVYVDGTPLTVLRPTQLIDRAGSVYKVKMPATFPVNLTGTWATDQLLLVDVGDASLRMALAVNTGGSQGSTLVGYESRTVYAKLAESVSVIDTGADPLGLGDSTASFAAAFATGRRVYAPKGTYLLNLTVLPNGATLYGDGPGSTIIKPLTNIVRGAITVNSSSSTTFVDNLTFRDLKFLGDVAASGFSEQVHLLTLNGVRNVLIENVHFVGFRGDGLYIGSGDVGGQERHNHNVTVQKCLFDGLNNDNRNGLSVIDGTNITIFDNTFQNCTRTNMPGAIDIEPDNAAFHVIDGVKILGNKFNNVGGNLGVISLYMGSSIVPSPRGILIDGNNFADSVLTTNHSDIFMGTTRSLTDSDIWSGIKIINNVGRNGSAPINIQAVKGVHIENNTWQGYTRGSAFGAQSLATAAPREIYHGNNKYIRCAYNGGAGMAVGNVDYLTHENNSFEDCGNGAAGSYALEYLPGASTYIKHHRNRFKTAGGFTLNGVVNSGAGWNPATNSQIGDDFLNGLSNSFAAYESDMALSSYLPVVEGAGTPGVGVYSVQIGRFRTEGKAVRGMIELRVNAGHTGTGLIEISLPLPAAAIGITYPCSVLSSEGITGAGSTAVAQLNPLASAGGVPGCIRLYANTSTTQTQLNIPAGAFIIWLEFEYMAA